MKLRCTLLVVAVATVASSGVSAQRMRTEEIVARAAEYLRLFVDRFANVVAEEKCVQDSKTFPLSRRRGQPRVPACPPAGCHVMSSSPPDFLLVQSPDKRWMCAFRDVFAVNGEPVRDREERLTKLFLQPLDAAVKLAERVASEGARYSLAGDARAVNTLCWRWAAFGPTISRDFISRFQVRTPSWAGMSGLSNSRRTHGRRFSSNVPGRRSSGQRPFVD